MDDTLVVAKCPDCQAEATFAMSMAAVADTEKGVTVLLMLLARCTHCFELRGDRRSIRVFLEIDEEVMVEAMAAGLPVVQITKKEK